MMAGIRAKDTKPELVLRMGLHRRGFRFRLHAPELPGKPDLVFPKYRAVLFAHGCFWHGHGCHLFKWPIERTDFWRAKITGNIARDRKTREKLVASGWRVGVVWECAIKGRTRRLSDEILDSCAVWLSSDVPTWELAGNEAGLSL
jgi:DNA mismatch endonuclease (patch repair protein)